MSSESESDESTVDESASELSEREPDIAEPTPMDMVRRYALPTIFVLAVFSMYFKDGDRTSASSSEPDAVAEMRDSTMGTTYGVQVVARLDANAEELLWQTVRTEIGLVDRQLSTYRDDSEISGFNEDEGIEPVVLSEPMMTVLQAASEIHEASGGAFDPTVGPLVELWGFGANRPSTDPSQNEIDTLLEWVGFDGIDLDSSGSTAHKRSGELGVDLSAIAKGYAVDLVGEEIEGLGYTSWFVEIGGEIRASGNNPQGIPWQVGIETPSEDDRSLWVTIPLVDMALATSGDYRNQRVVDGRLVSHTLDPRTGRPIDHGLASVSVLHASCMWADGWATALTVLGLEAGLELANERGLAALFIQRSSEGLVEYTTQHWQSYMDEHSMESGTEDPSG